MMAKLKDLIRFIIDAEDVYAGSGMMMALYFVALMIILFYVKDKKLKKSILLPSVLLMGILYILVPVYNTFFGYLEYYDGRLFWIIITPVVTAVALTYFVTNIENRKLRPLALLLIIPIALYCGEFKISDAMYKKSENQYRLPQAAVDITNYMLERTEDPILVVPYTFAHPFRQISSDVYLLYGEDASYGRILGTSAENTIICEEMEKVRPSLGLVVPLSVQQDADYIAFDTVYTEFCEDGNINIYGYPEDKNYVGDRSTDQGFYGDVHVVDDEKGVYWDLTSQGLNYEGTFGQYVLYSFIK